MFNNVEYIGKTLLIKLVTFNISLFFVEKQRPLAQSLKIFQTKGGRGIGRAWPNSPLLCTPLVLSSSKIEVSGVPFGAY